MRTGLTRTIRSWYEFYPVRFFLGLGLLLLAAAWLAGRLSDASSLPAALRREIETTYSHCVAVVGSEFRGDMNPERACREIDVEVVGDGALSPADSSGHVTRAVCLRVLLRSPSWLTPSRTQFEEIGWTERSLSKVALLENGEWVLPPDEDSSDRVRWEEYACPGDF